jgi:hypothetical protein
MPNDVEREPPRAFERGAQRCCHQRWVRGMSGAGNLELAHSQAFGIQPVKILLGTEAGSETHDLCTTLFQI